MKKTLLPTHAIKILQDKVQTLRKYATVVCCGVYGGGDIIAMNKVRPDLNFVAIDSFEGLAEPTEHDGGSMGDFAYNLNTFRENMKGINCLIITTWINRETLPCRIIPKPHMLWLDLDHKQPTEACLDYFVPRMKNDGIVLTHDYTNENYPGVRMACDAFGQWDDLGASIAQLRRP